MSAFMCSTQAMKASRSSLGKSGSRTRWTATPWRSSERRQPPAAARDHVDLDAERHELLGQLAHVAREAALHDRRVLPGQDQDAHRARGYRSRRISAQGHSSSGSSTLKRTVPPSLGAAVRVPVNSPVARQRPTPDGWKLSAARPALTAGR